MLALSGPFENTITTLRPGTFAASRKRQQQRVVQRRIVARHRVAQALNGLGMLARERSGARKIAAERVDRHRIGVIHAAHEIRDGVLRVHEAAVHEVAGVEQDEDVGADERVRLVHPRQRFLPGFQHRARGAVGVDGHRRIRALRERGKLLQDSIFVDTKIGRLQAVNVVVLAVRHLKVQHHHVHFHAENGSLAVLRMQKNPARCGAKKSSSRDFHDLYRSPREHCRSVLLPFNQPHHPDLILKARLLLGRQIRAHVLPDIVAHQAKRLQNRRPIFQMRSENMLHQLLVHCGIRTLSCDGEMLISSASPAQ